MEDLVPLTLAYTFFLHVAYRAGVINERDNPGDIETWHVWAWTRHEWRAHVLIAICLAASVWLAFNFGGE